jgi:hypothetical protein
MDGPKPGDLVSMDVEWPNGRVSRMTGKLLVIKEDEAVIESSLGPVIGPVDSLEHEEDEDGD